MHLSSETCKQGSFRINQPIDPDRPTGPKRNVRVLTTGCNRRAKFLIPMLPDAYFAHHVDVVNSDKFDFDDDNSPTATMQDGITPALTHVCAVDDAMGLWPRFQSAMQTGESFEPVE